MIHERIDELERDLVTLRNAVAELVNSVSLVKVEQIHTKELVGARLQLLEKGIELAVQKLDLLTNRIDMLASDAEKSPMGRFLISRIQQSDGLQAHNADRLDEHQRKHEEAVEWRNRVEGVLFLLKWIGGAGLIGLLIQGIRAIKGL